MTEKAYFGYERDHAGDLKPVRYTDRPYNSTSGKSKDVISLVELTEEDEGKTIDELTAKYPTSLN